MLKEINKDVKEKLRLRRKTECFSIINRGKLWYDSLTSEQLEELREWYWKWLNVTDTLVVPATPNFLKNKLVREEIIL